MRDRDEKKEMYLKGHLEESEELCDDGTQALVIVTDDGDEYYIKNKKKIRKLQKYAFYDDIELEFHGILKYDLEGLPVFSIISYTPPKNNAAEQDEASYSSVAPKKTKRRRKEEDDDEETEGLDEVIELPDDDEEFDEDNDDFDDDSEFEEDEVEEDNGDDDSNK
ncbi:MAG: hypothetical protein IKP00_16140 [Victivallales bacterium]|nr:hypothetical protein [Victivallales bacterium]